MVQIQDMKDLLLEHMIPTNSVGQILQVGANSTVTWTNTIDGGTFS